MTGHNIPYDGLTILALGGGGYQEQTVVSLGVTSGLSFLLEEGLREGLRTYRNRDHQTSPTHESSDSVVS